MKKLILTGLLYIIVVLFNACRSNEPINKEVYIIDARSKTDMFISSLFDAKVIPLESAKDSSMIGIGITKVEYINGLLYVQNYTNSRINLLCFDTTGRFIFTLDRIGKGPDRYANLSDFMIDPISNKLLLVVESGRYMIFDNDGYYVSQIRQDSPKFYSRQFIRTNDSTYTVFHNGDFPKGSDLLEVDSRTFTIRKSAQATDPLASEGARPLSLWDGRLLYYQMNDTIYDATDIQNRRPLYYLNFGKNQRDTEEKARRMLTESGDREQMLTQMGEAFVQGKYMFVTRLFENPRWIVISGLKQHAEKKSDELRSIPFFILYDKKSGKSYNSDRISWDILNMGPLTNIDIAGCDNEGTLYAIWYNVPTEEQKQQISRSDKFPQAVKDKLMKLEDGDNPVLFMLK